MNRGHPVEHYGQGGTLLTGVTLLNTMNRTENNVYFSEYSFSLNFLNIYQSAVDNRKPKEQF